MATFTYDQTVYQRARTEIRLGIYPSSDASAAIELYRAVQGSTGTFKLLTTLYPTAGQSVAQYDDLIPDDNLTRYYKARSLRGTVPSTAYTATVSAKPAPYLLNTVMTPALSGAAISVPILVSTAATLNVWSAGAPGTITKTIRIPYTAFQPGSTATSYLLNIIGGGYLTPNKISGGGDFYAPVIVPRGCHLVTLRFNAYRGSTHETLTLDFLRSGTNGGTNGVGSLNYSSATGWVTKVGTFASSEVSQAGYLAHLIMKTSAASSSGQSAKFGYIELDYKMSAYHNAY